LVVKIKLHHLFYTNDLRLKLNILSAFILFILFFSAAPAWAAGNDTTITFTSTQQQAIAFIDAIDSLSPSGYWPHIKSSLFLKNLKLNVHQPLSFYPGRGTNFCAYGALSYLVIKDDPLGYAKFMLALYRDGKASYNNNKFTPSESIMAVAGTLKFKGVLDIRHAEQMWFLVLADHFKGYLNRMVRRMCHYKTQAVGSDLVHPWLKNTFKYLNDRQHKGVVVLYINNRVIHKHNHDKVILSIPTHFVVLENISMDKNDLITLTYWDYGARTLLQFKPKVLKKIIYGVSFCTKNDLP
jgi:hypothetical protein